jgi:hypothetical protein
MEGLVEFNKVYWMSACASYWTPRYQLANKDQKTKSLEFGATLIMGGLLSRED